MWKVDLNPPITIATLWDVCIYYLWDDTFVKGVEKVFNTHGVKTILDTAGGTGFPSIALRKRGWDVNYADGSRTMFENYKKHLADEKVDMLFQLVEWKNLTHKIQKQYDAVMCRGNSLSYVDAWNEDLIELHPEHMKLALENFYKLIKPGGILYIDTVERSEFEKTKFPIVWNFGERHINGHKVKLVRFVSHDYTRGVRIWSHKLIIDNRSYEFSCTSYLLTPEQLRSLLGETGFTNVKETSVSGEEWYTVFVCRKPK
ncbi:MAG: class I SAM-dependent methyltransferase [Patescibacteria group bacterium]